MDFVCGMGAAHLVADELRGHGRIRGARWIMGGAVACLLAGFSLNYGHWAPYSVIDALWAFGFAGLICAVSGGAGWGYRAFCFRPLMALGVCSYSVYLLHAPLMERAGFLTSLYLRPGKAFLVGMALLPVVIAICAGFFWVCERPAMAYFDRKRPAKGARPQSQQASVGEPLVLERAVG
jgi:peptidoglycan/LPS O-acetylase OafA/YrhL